MARIRHPFLLAAAALALLFGLTGCAGGPHFEYWHYEPVRMDGAKISPSAKRGTAAVPPSREEWDARSAPLPFRAVTVRFMWDSAGLYGTLSGARISASIQVETSSAGGVEPAGNAEPVISVWIGGHDDMRTGGRLVEVSRADFEWEFAPGPGVPKTREDRFFLPWTTLGMSGPPRGPQNVEFAISDVGLLDVERGGAWLTWNDSAAPPPNP